MRTLFLLTLTIFSLVQCSGGSGGTIPSLDAACIQDLQANEGK